LAIQTRRFLSLLLLLLLFPDLKQAGDLERVLLDLQWN
jgi:hypothetical protein